jgi:hypothetical protein
LINKTKPNKTFKSMMKKMRLFSSIALLGVMALAISCDDEGTDIGGGGSVPVADGFYIAKVGAIPTTSDQLLDEGVEDGFGSKVREGFFATYTFLSAGNYELVNVVDQEVRKKFGGVTTEATDDAVGCGPDTYKIIEEVAENGAALAIASDGFYKVAYDNTLKEFWALKIEKAQVNGDALEGIGWDGSAASQMSIVGAASATEVKFEVTNLTMRPNSWKVRFNCGWTVDRTIAPNTAETGYKAFTNIGADATGEQSAWPSANFAINYSEDGKYTITAKWTPADGLVVTKTKTEALTFEPFTVATNQWAITGSATTADWPANNDCGAANEDVDFTTITLTGNAFKAEGTFALTDQAGNGFKLRKNDCWNGDKGYGQVTTAGAGASLLQESGGNWQVKAGNAGNYKLTLETNDFGKKWTLTVVKQ